MNHTLKYSVSQVDEEVTQELVDKTIQQLLTVEKIANLRIEFAYNDPFLFVKITGLATDAYPDNYVFETALNKIKTLPVKLTKNVICQMCFLPLDKHPKCIQCKRLLEVEPDEEATSEYTKYHNIPSEHSSIHCVDCFGYDVTPNIKNNCSYCGIGINLSANDYIERGNHCVPCNVMFADLVKNKKMKKEVDDLDIFLDGNFI